MDNWNEEIDLEAILREYGGEQDVTFPEPEADAAELPNRNSSSRTR